VLRASQLRHHGHTQTSTRTLGSVSAELGAARTTDVQIPLSTTARTLLRGVSAARVTATAILSAPDVASILRLTSAAVTLGR